MILMRNYIFFNGVSPRTWVWKAKNGKMNLLQDTIYIYCYQLVRFPEVKLEWMINERGSSIFPSQVHLAFSSPPSPVACSLCIQSMFQFLLNVALRVWGQSCPAYGQNCTLKRTRKACREVSGRAFACHTQGPVFGSEWCHKWQTNCGNSGHVLLGAPLPANSLLRTLTCERGLIIKML